MNALTITYKTNDANIENYMENLCFPCLLATAVKSCTGYLPSNWYSVSGVSLYSSKGSSMGLHSAVGLECIPVMALVRVPA